MKKSFQTIVDISRNGNNIQFPQNVSLIIKQCHYSKKKEKKFTPIYDHKLMCDNIRQDKQFLYGKPEHQYTYSSKALGCVTPSQIWIFVYNFNNSEDILAKFPTN